jgi:hypothetical protein
MNINAKSGIKNIRAMLKSPNAENNDSVYKKKTISHNEGDTDKSLSFNVTPDEEDIKRNLLTLDIIEEGK